MTQDIIHIDCLESRRLVYSCIADDFPHNRYQQAVFWIPEKEQDRACLRGDIYSTRHAALNWVYYSEAVDDNDNELPTGPGLLYSLTHLKVWIEGTGDTFFCINCLLCLTPFQIWRCWVVWNRRWPVVVLPIFATIAGAVLAGLIISDQVGALRSSEAFIVAKKSADFVRLSTIYFSLSAVGDDQVDHDTFHLLENSPASTAAQKDRNRPHVQSAPGDTHRNIHAQMAGFAPLLIILRDAAGYSRPVEEWSTRLSGDSANTSTTTDSKIDAEA
ncbi:hypothetical protein DFH08DRAFT_805454 [Mycena albidolilacea]|uniref:Uncharacterized protein n=1 Tax=Mycena albidolilacea TaxID=1033008 RepID=A0AAD7A9N5_9AGAR|nr:hypothetical protein DFH08DRAFT_805454 [Mycena albidolilacea]